MLCASRQHVKHSMLRHNPLMLSARKHLCYCTECAKKLKEPLLDEQEIKCPVCEKLVVRVIMNDGPYFERCPTCLIDPTCAVRHGNT